jgi:hypothetical protein
MRQASRIDVRAGRSSNQFMRILPGSRNWASSKKDPKIGHFRIGYLLDGYAVTIRPAGIFGSGSLKTERWQSG